MGVKSNWLVSSALAGAAMLLPMQAQAQTTPPPLATILMPYSPPPCVGFDCVAGSNLSSNPIMALVAINAVLSQPARAFVSGKIDPAVNETGIAPWIRTMVGQFDLDMNASTTTGAGVQVDSADSANDYFGVHGGLDFGIFNINGTGWDWQTGLHAGFVGVNSDFADGSTRVETPFFGVYSSLSNGTWAIDALVRFDDHEIELTNPGLVGGSTTVDGDGFGAMIAVSYAHRYGNNVILTPEIGLNYLEADAGAFVIAGGDVQEAGIESLLGHASLKLAQTIPVVEGLFAQPFVQATIVHDFIEDNTVSGTFGGGAWQAVTPSVGTYGQVSFGVSTIAPGRPKENTNFMTFLRGDLQFGDTLDGVAFNAGARIQY